MPAHIMAALAARPDMDPRELLSMQHVSAALVSHISHILNTAAGKFPSEFNFAILLIVANFLFRLITANITKILKFRKSREFDHSGPGPEVIYNIYFHFKGYVLNLWITQSVVLLCAEISFQIPDF